MLKYVVGVECDSTPSVPDASTNYRGYRTVSATRQGYQRYYSYYYGRSSSYRYVTEYYSNRVDVDQ